MADADLEVREGTTLKKIFSSFMVASFSLDFEISNGEGRLDLPLHISSYLNNQSV